MSRSRTIARQSWITLVFDTPCSLNWGIFVADALKTNQGHFEFSN